MIISSAIGHRGEDLAVSFLEKQGYLILERNFRSKFGEIDIIAKDKDTICFVEVKTRQDEDILSLLESVSFFKQRKLIKTAYYYFKLKHLNDPKARFDVVAINLDAKEDEQIKIIKNAFGLEGM